MQVEKRSSGSWIKDTFKRRCCTNFVPKATEEDRKRYVHKWLNLIQSWPWWFAMVWSWLAFINFDWHVGCFRLLLEVSRTNNLNRKPSTELVCFQKSFPFSVTKWLSVFQLVFDWGSYILQFLCVFVCVRGRSGILMFI